LKDIIKEERYRNTELHETASVTKTRFWGMLRGEEYWGESFVSVTTASSNDNYKVVNSKSIAYDPARANIGSFGINLTDKKFAVSPMYVIFKVINKNFLPEFVFLCIRSKEGIQNVKDRSFGSVRQTLRFEDLCTISIPAISIEQQQIIVSRAKKLYKQFSALKDELENFDVNEAIHQN
jgi:restriction endonuclease S subunit